MWTGVFPAKSCDHSFLQFLTPLYFSSSSLGPQIIPGKMRKAICRGQRWHQLQGARRWVGRRSALGTAAGRGTLLDRWLLWGNQH